MKFLGTSTDAQGGVGIELGRLCSQGSTLLDRIPERLSQDHTALDVRGVWGFHQECP